MNYEMRMPDLATTGSAIKVVRWLKSPGQTVQRGEFLLEIETDKSAMEIECPVHGVLHATKTNPGDEVASGDIIALFDVADAPAAPTPASPPPKAENHAPAAPKPQAAGGLFARNRAAKVADAPAAPGTAVAPIPLSAARRTAARRLTESKQSIPHFYLQSSANAAALLVSRQQSSPPPVWDALFVRAASRVLRKFALLKHRYEDGGLVPAERDSIGVAVDIDDELFVVPVHDPETKSIAQISADIRDAVTRLRAGDPGSQRLSLGVMTISNLGSTGVEAFTAIINPPEASILAIGAVRDVVVPHDGRMVVEPRVQLSPSVDHRVVNGKYAATFLAALVAELENPS